MSSHGFDDHFPGCGSMGAFARAYGSLGYRVLPLARGAKKPHGVLGDSGGVHWASSEGWRWWEQAPHANIGIACGAGLVVLDLDVKNGANGYGTLLDEASRLGLDFPGPPLVLAETPSGGLHIWMHWPWAGGVPNRTGILPGVDVKGDGGYVVAPPSGLVMPRLEGGQEHIERIVPYSWRAGCPCGLPTVTESLGEWIATARATGAQNGAAGTAVAPLDGLPGPGERNHWFSRKAASLFRQHGTDAAGESRVRAELHGMWDQIDHRGFPLSELSVIISHARAFVAREEKREREWMDSATAGWLRNMRPGGQR